MRSTVGYVLFQISNFPISNLFKVVIRLIAYCEVGRKGGFFVEVETAELALFVFLVSEAAFGASEDALGVRGLENVAVSAHPAVLSGGNSHHKGVIGHIFGDYCPGRYEAVSAECYTADDGRIGTDGSSSTNKCFLVEALAFDLGTGVGDVRQHT